jgi:malonyl-CoA/methylmalonyl-CoA synthetase
MGLYERWRQSWDPQAIAITTGSESIGYRELDARVSRAAGWLRSRGVGRGDVVGLAMPKEPAFLELALACLRLGAVALPLNDRYTPRELAWPLADARARLAVLPSGIAVPDGPPAVPADQVRAALDAAAPLEQVDPVPDDLAALLLYTSGTTGRPKGAPATHRNLNATVEALHQAWEWRRDDVLLHALPQYHVHGLVVATFGALRAGAAAIVLDRFDPVDVLQRLAAGPATIFMGVPTFHARMLEAPGDYDLRRVRLVTSGSAGLPADTHRALARRFGVEVVERYGMTEIGIVVSNPLRGERRPGSIGLPLPGVEVRVVRDDGADALPDEVGELWVRGDSVFSGYLGNPAATAEVLVDGWMKTGDLSRRAADGWLTLVGRRSELVIVGGLNVYPAEIEAALLRCPGVREAAVVGVPDPDLGEVPVAAIVGEADPEEVRARVRTELAGYKVPRRIEVLDQLPRNAMGKVAKRELSVKMCPPEVP